MEKTPFFITEIIKNTSGNGPETIPVFCHLFSPFLMIFTSFWGPCLVKTQTLKSSFPDFFWHFSPFLWFFLWPAFSSSGGAPEAICHLFGPILPPFLLQNHAKSLPERASVSDDVPSPFSPDPRPISDMCEHRISCWRLQNNSSRAKSPFSLRA